MKSQPASYEYPFSATLPYQVEDPNPVETIIHAVCREWRLSPSVVLSKSREQDICECRMVCMYFLKAAGNTLKRVGEIVGLTHSAVYHDLTRLEDYINTSPKLKNKIDIIRQAV